MTTNDVYDTQLYHDELSLKKISVLISSEGSELLEGSVCGLGPCGCQSISEQEEFESARV